MRHLSISLIKSPKDEASAGLLIYSASEKLNNKGLSEAAIDCYLENLSSYSLKQIRRGLCGLISQRTKLSLALLIESIEEQKQPINLCKNIFNEVSFYFAKSWRGFKC